METLYLVCAVAGGTFLALQVVLLLIGVGSDGDLGGGVGGDTGAGVGADLGGDVGADAGAAASGHAGGDYNVDSGEGASGAASAHAFQVISTKTLTAFFTFFGLGGLLAGNLELTTVPGAAMALGCGLVALFVVAYLWSLLFRLQSSGNVDLRRVVGSCARVYLRVPGHGAGHGKVTVVVQGRTLELPATTTGEDIPTGAEVKVVGLIGSETLKVVRSEGS